MYNSNWILVICVILQCYTLLTDDPRGTAAGFHFGTTVVSLVLFPTGAVFPTANLMVVLQSLTLIGHLLRSELYWRYVYFGTTGILVLLL